MSSKLPQYQSALGRLRPGLWGGAFLAGLASFGMNAETRPETSRTTQEVERSAEYDYDIPHPGTYALPEIMKAGDGVVLDSDGSSLSLKETMRGRITLLSFIYTRCPDPRACPMATGALRELHELSARDPALRMNLLLASMSFDPARDTPRVMQVFARVNRRQEDGAPWRFFTTPTQETLQPILDAYGQVLDRRRDDPAQRIYHPVRVYLIDRRGMVRNIYSFGLLDPRLVATDVRTLLLEEASGERAEN
jgi:cytochrome oxidase Cu insertion factor (SCO1/SenC/PrrC family)